MVGVPQALMIGLQIFQAAGQGHIFPKIQPTTICRIELTSDRNQAKTQ